MSRALVNAYMYLQFRIADATLHVVLMAGSALVAEDLQLLVTVAGEHQAGKAVAKLVKAAHAAGQLPVSDYPFYTTSLSLSRAPHHLLHPLFSTGGAFGCAGFQ
jgi:hypothetical protein